MTFLSDAAVARLRAAAEIPDLTGSRYRLMEKLGEGGMGAVYRVDDTVLRRQVALKVINVIDSQGQLAARLLREARIIAQLEHPGIIPVHDSGTLPDGRVFYTMKLVQGKRLDDHIRELTALPERLRIFQKICEPVAFAHARGVLHRDLKPANVMIGPFGEVLVMDWGVSKLLVSCSQRSTSSIPADGAGQACTDGLAPDAAAGETEGFDTAYGTVIGTPGYMAPEQARGERVDQRCDVYSLGAILNSLLNVEDARDPAQPRTPLGICRRRILDAIAAKAMAAKVEERYPSVRELMADIEHYIDGLAVSAYPEGMLARARRWIVRNRVWILLVLAYIVMRTLLILFRQR
jgi:eukaryotic-like serine/threonine-protein kinase